MLHELLLALNGCTGNIFIETSSGDIKVVENLSFIHPTEVALLNRLCKIATYYKYFQDFIQSNGKYKVDAEGAGLYLKALCQGLDEILAPYRTALVKIEKEVLADPHLTPAYVQSILEEYQLLFPALWNIINQIKQQKVVGCHILEVLHRACGCGIPIVTTAFTRLLFVCHQVFYKQLTAWILHGLLLDPYNEFIVQKSQDLEEQQEPTVEEDELGLGGITGRQLQQLLNIQSSMSENTGKEHFAIIAEMLPSYIPIRVAEKIQFVGESVQMFECEKSNKSQRESILSRKEYEFGKKLHELSQLSEFDLLLFEGVIDEIRVYVSEQLWRLVVEEASLLMQLRKMKEFYLLGRGELFLAFIDRAGGLLRGPPTATTQHDVNMAFQQAARRVLLEDDTIMQHFTFNVAPTKKLSASKNEGQSIAETGWSVLSLNYSVQWPLHILFNKTVLGRYNTIFRFLLFVKRTQLELQKCWALQMQCKNINNIQAEKWWLRNHMAFLVDNLQYYLQVDVIESQFSNLIEKIESTRDFEQIRLAHETFITSLLSQSFLQMRPISRCLLEIFNLCHTFCSLLQQPHHLGDVDQQRLQDVSKSFERQSSLLLTMLSSVRSHQASPHLAQLLLRIDFNKYFTIHNAKVVGQMSSVMSVTGSC